MAGVCTAIAISAMLIMKEGGNPYAALTAMALGGRTDFGQRDHLALIFVLPYLSTRQDRPTLGLWAFLGVGLKPYFILIPLFFVTARCLTERSIRPVRAQQNVVLAIGCFAYVFLVLIAWPQYFADFVPTGRFVYAAYHIRPDPAYFLIAIFMLLMLLIVALSRPALIPLAVATIGALTAFFLQGRYWSYQFIPAIGLTIYALGLAFALERGVMRLTLGFIYLMLAGRQILIGPATYGPNPIPHGIRSVMFLSDHVSAAYPHVFECRAINTSRFPALWTLPGA